MKKRIFVVFIIIFILLMISGIGVMSFVNERDKSILLLQDNVVIEYGNTYNPTISEVIDLSKYDFINLDNVILKTNIENEEGKEYPAVGEYEVDINYKNVNLKQKIEVKDTIAPELSIKDNIEIPFDTDLATYNFQELISVSDLSKVSDYDIDTSNINVSSSGEYVAKVSVTDIYLNKTEKEFKVRVQEKVQEEKTEEIVMDNSNNTQKKKVVKETTTVQQEKAQVNSKIAESNRSTTSQPIINNEPTNNQNAEKNGTSASNHTVENNAPSSTQINNEKVETHNPTPSDLEYWCVDGGNHHVLGDGANECGYFSSWAEADNACKSYTQDWQSIQYKIGQCSCGLYYFWAIQ